jgi:hypothetical protein
MVKWLMNNTLDSVEEQMRTLAARVPSRVLNTGDPMPTENESVDELKKRGIVGIYALEVPDDDDTPQV